VRTQFVLPLVALVSLGAPAGASAHARSPTVALDYRLVLAAAPPALGVSVSILDGDRDLRVTSRRTALVVLGDLGEPMLRIGPGGVWVDRASVTAQAARLTTAGRGWSRVASGSSFAWHEHRLTPPPYDAARLGPVARFRIPVVLGGRRFAIAGTFVRVRRPSILPWLAAAGAVVAAAFAAAWLRPRLRRGEATLLGVVAALAALAMLVVFGAADAPNGRVQWVQLGLAAFLAAVALGVLARLGGARRAHFAAVLGAAAAAVSLGSFGVFRHGAVISLVSAAVSRTLVAAAFAAGVGALATGLFVEER